jgi:hypothetical protein
MPTGSCELGHGATARRDLPTNPVIYLFANVLNGKAVALLNLTLEPKLTDDD